MVNCIGALVWRRDGDKSVVMIVDIDFCNSNNKKQHGVTKVSANGIAMLKINA